MLLLQSELRYLCEGKEYTLDFRRQRVWEGISVSLTLEHGRLKAVLHANKECTLLGAKLTFSYPFDRNTAIFLNGYQSATHCIEQGVQDKQKGIARMPAKAFSLQGDYAFYAYDNKPGKLHGYTYGYFREDKRYTLIGSLSEKEGFTLITTDALAGFVEVQKPCAGSTLTRDLTLFDLCIFRGGEDTVFDAYFAAMQLPKPQAKPFLGYRYTGRLAQTLLQRDILAKGMGACKPEVYLLDTGKEAAQNTLLSPELSAVMQSAAAAIKRRDMIPGILLTPFLCSSDTALYGAHPDMFLADEDGQPLEILYRGKTYGVLDFESLLTREHIKNLFETVRKQWGYAFIKCEGLYAACLMPSLGNTRGGLMCMAMDFIRECAGDAILYAADVPLGAAFGKAEYCAVTPEISSNWDGGLIAKLPYYERPSTKAVICNAVFRRQLQGRAFGNGAGLFTLSHKASRLTAMQKTWLSKIQSITGSVLMTYDDVAKYTTEQVMAMDALQMLRAHHVLSATWQKDKLFVCSEHEGDVNALLIPMSGKL